MVVFSFNGRQLEYFERVNLALLTLFATWWILSLVDQRQHEGLVCLWAYLIYGFGCWQVCRKCGLLGYYNYKLKTSYCSMCKNGENMAKIRLPYACKLLFQVAHNFLGVLVQLYINSMSYYNWFKGHLQLISCGSVVWFQELQSMNVVPRLKLTEG